MLTFIQTASSRAQRTIKLLAYAACAAPLLWTTYQIYSALNGQNDLGANPIETIIRRLGEVALYLLTFTLAITPLRTLFKAPWLLKLRRLFGVSTFAYASLHLLAYSGWDQTFNLEDILIDTAKRPFIFVGMAAWLLMLPLAATSFNAAIKWLGGKRWQLLHKAVYAVALLGPLHFWWIKSAKNDFVRPAMFVGFFAVLLGWRVLRYLKTRRNIARSAPL
jgi:methionine sulfoxide reductase heme-binding subunit